MLAFAAPLYQFAQPSHPFPNVVFLRLRSQTHPLYTPWPTADSAPHHPEPSSGPQNMILPNRSIWPPILPNHLNPLTGPPDPLTFILLMSIVLILHTRLKSAPGSG